MFTDYLFYGTDVEIRYAFRMVQLSNLVLEACEKHNLSSFEQKEMLSNTLVAGVLLSSILQEEERVLLKIGHPQKFVCVSETTMHAQTRGYLTSFSMDNASNFIDGQSLQCQSKRSHSSHVGLFEGQTELACQSLEDLVNDHLKKSFQVNAQLKLETWENERTGKLEAFGAIFLELPGQTEALAQRLWSHVHDLSGMKQIFTESEGDPDRIARRLIPDQTHPIRSVTPVWQCTCSQTYCEGILSSLPKSEIESMIEDGKPIDMRCHYCNKSYQIHTARLHEIATGLTLAQTQDKHERMN